MSLMQVISLVNLVARKRSTVHRRHVSSLRPYTVKTSRMFENSVPKLPALNAFLLSAAISLRSWRWSPALRVRPQYRDEWRRVRHHCAKQQENWRDLRFVRFMMSFPGSTDAFWRIRWINVVFADDIELVGPRLLRDETTAGSSSQPTTIFFQSLHPDPSLRSDSPTSCDSTFIDIGCSFVRQYMPRSCNSANPVPNLV